MALDAEAMDGATSPVVPEGLDAARPTMGGGRNRRIKVLFFIGSMGGGGAERFYATVLRRLDRGRFEPVLVMIEPVVAYALPDDVRIVVLGKARPWHVPASILRLRRVIDTERPDVVFSTMWFYNLMVGEALRWTRERPPWIARVVIPPDKHRFGWYRAWVRRSYAVADHIQALAPGTAKALAIEIPSVRKRIHVLEDLIDFTRVDEQSGAGCDLALPDKPLVVAMARLTRQKRCDRLIAAFSRVRRTVDCHLVLLGEGELRPALEEQIALLGLQDSVSLPGFRENPYPLLKRGAVFAHSADYEGLCVAIIEAQGLGLPVVSTDCPYGPCEIVEHGRTGFLVEVEDEEGLAARILELLRNPQMARAMGRAGQSRVRERFSWETRGIELTDLLERTAGYAR